MMMRLMEFFALRNKEKFVIWVCAAEHHTPK
jgi:hypothetical protein